MFFFKMAVLLCLTVVFSAIFSLIWLMALLAFIGPEGHTGDVNQMCGKGNKIDKVDKADNNFTERDQASSVTSLNPTFQAQDL
jgi:hypothetical protein